MLAVGERSCDYAPPRQVAWLEEAIVTSPTHVVIEPCAK